MESCDKRVARKLARRLFLVALTTFLSGSLRNAVFASGLFETHRPIRAVYVKIGRNGRDLFFEKMREFANSHALATRIAPTSPDSQTFLVQLWREDVKLVAVNTIEADEFFVGFYQNGSVPLPNEAFETLVADFKQKLGEVKEFSFSEGI